MRNIIYEKVNLSKNIPALVEYFGKENFDMKKYFYIPPHWHRSIELTFITEGELVGVINGKRIRVQGGDFIFVNSGDVHEIEKYQGKVCQGVILILSYDFIKSVYSNIDNIRLDIKELGCKKHRLCEIFLEMKKFSLNPKELDYIKITSYIYEVLHILLSNCIISMDKDYTENYFKYREKQKEILTYISENYKKDLTLDHIAKHFYMSSGYFSRKFHQWFGVNYKLYLSQFRLHKAYEDIVNTEGSIQDIATYHGFLNVKSFINLFKEKYRMTPLKYRNYLKESKNDTKMDKKEQQ